MPDIKHLKEQLERARRFASHLGSAEDRRRIRVIVQELERQIRGATALTPKSSNRHRKINRRTRVIPKPDA